MHKKAISIGIIAASLVFLDGIITRLIGIDSSLTWVAFINCTVFFGSSTKERFKAIPGYIIGFILAITIIKLGGILTVAIPLKILGVAVGSILATGIINWGCMYFEKLNKIHLDSISGIFVGIALTFSGLGVGLDTNTINSSLQMLLLIITYGILGLISGYLTLKINK